MVELEAANAASSAKTAIAQIHDPGSCEGCASANSRPPHGLLDVVNRIVNFFFRQALFKKIRPIFSGPETRMYHLATWIIGCLASVV